MGTLLLVLLAISFFVILLGYILSLRSQQHDQRTTYYADRYAERVRVRGMQQQYGVPLRARRNTTQASLNVSTGGAWPMAVVGRLFRRPGEPTSWMGLGLIFVTLLLSGVFLLRALLPNVALVGFTLSSTAAAPTVPVATPNPLQGKSDASHLLVRLSQLDPAQYNSSQEYNLWSLSTCSAAAMTEVINAYGHKYRITDILKVEYQLGDITPQLGLLYDTGVANTASHFGFKTLWGHQFSLDQVIATANKGRPVIVSFPPDRYPQGHLVVVTGGDNNSVSLADSSIYNRHTISRAQFLKWWGGFYAVLIPNSQWK